MTNLYIFGDSIAQGAWDPLGGWVQRIRTTLDQIYFHDENKQCLTFNMGVSGNTSQDIVNRFTKEMNVRQNKDQDSMIIFATGMNDSLIMQDNGMSVVSPDLFEKNLDKLWVRAKKYSKKICFVGLTPVNEDIVNPLPWAPDRSYWNSSLQQYNEIISNFCAEKNIKCIDMWQDWIDHDYRPWLFDGVHPNAEGHQRIASAILSRFLKPAGWFVPEEDEGGYITLK